MTAAYDVVIVGAGLAGGLAALALRRRRPRLRVALIEAGAIGGNHTWSFHATDVEDDGARLLEPLVIRRWSRVEVAFADHQRRLPLGYASITSTSLASAIELAFQGEPAGSQLILGRRALRLTAHEVHLEGGEILTAPLVLDARGPAAPPRWVENQGFQKFVGLEVELPPGATGVDPDVALVMDARVPQLDGFRFVYLLPLAEHRLLVEDTCYSDGPELDRDLFRTRALGYLKGRGIEVARVVREESGVLSIPFTDDGVPPLGSPLRLGVRGGWFHPTTGYTLPVAVKVALTLAAHPPSEVWPALAALHARVQSQARFFRKLNRLLFRAAAPGERWRLLSRFYRLPQPVIERFYALASTSTDRARILLGRPPRGISLSAAFAVLQGV